MSDTVPTYVYVTYIRAGAEQVWHALTDADVTARYWGHSNVSDWRPGSSWEHRRLDGSGEADLVGRVRQPRVAVGDRSGPAAGVVGDVPGETVNSVAAGDVGRSASID